MTPQAGKRRQHQVWNDSELPVELWATAPAVGELDSEMPHWTDMREAQEALAVQPSVPLMESPCPAV